MITASHNKIEDNGAKIIDFTGGMLREKYEKQIEIFINEKNILKAIENFLSYLENEKEEINLKEKGNIIIGYDTRPSSKRLIDLIM